jgi:outer membrane immunogenic protein
MKQVLLACCSTLALVSAATAADLPPRYPVTRAPYYAPVYNWTGFYLGFNAGGGWGSSTWDSTGDFDLSGGLVGLTAGYNWQVGTFVFGLEGDIDWTNIKGHTFAFCAPGCETSNSWLATVRGRIGYTFDRFMPYLTGGLAIGDIRAHTPGYVGQDDTNFGWTVGTGLEIGLFGTWTAKAEYLYVDLGDINCGLGCGLLASDHASFSTHIVRGGVNFRF